MLETYKIAIDFAPIVFFAAIGAFLFAFNQLNFNRTLSLLAGGILARIAIGIFITGSWGVVVAQTVIALIAFGGLVYLLGGKASGDSILSVCALIALTPLPWGLIAVAVTLIGMVVLAFIQVKDAKEVMASVANATIATGLAQGVPNYDYLPDRKNLDRKAKRVTIMPIIAICYFLMFAFFLLQPLWLES